MAHISPDYLLASGKLWLTAGLVGRSILTDSWMKKKEQRIILYDKAMHLGLEANKTNGTAFVLCYSNLQRIKEQDWEMPQESQARKTNKRLLWKECIVNGQDEIRGKYVNVSKDEWTETNVLSLLTSNSKQTRLISSEYVTLVKNGTMKHYWDQINIYVVPSNCHFYSYKLNITTLNIKSSL